MDEELFKKLMEGAITGIVKALLEDMKQMKESDWPDESHKLFYSCDLDEYARRRGIE